MNGDELDFYATPGASVISARAGFASYLGGGWVDHWIVERWDERTALIDEIAGAVTSGRLAQWRRLYGRDGVRVPETVHSHRLQ